MKLDPIHFAKSSLVSVIALLLVLGSGLALAADVEKVETRGEAAIVGGDKAAARDKAIDDALRKAVEQAVGTLVSSETITENYQLLSDRIYSKAEGYVKNYKITGEREEDGVLIVEIRAEVSTGAVAADVEGLQTLLKRKGKPKMLLMIAEQNIGMADPAYWWGKGGPVSVDLRTVETTLMEAMGKKGFTFIDPEVLSGKKSINLPVALVSEQQAMRVADLTDAQIIVVGQAVAKDIGRTWEGTNMRSANATVTVKVINTDNGLVIATASKAGAAYHLDSRTAGQIALKNASQALADELMTQIAQKWSAEVAGTLEVRMVVSGVTTRKQLTEFITILRDQVRSVKDVREESNSAGQAVLSIDLAGEVRAMATELEAKNFGSLKVQVTKVTGNSLTVILTK
ncbi:MAG TPA: flagellar assembly protein T N-terminal domain-containing protein [Myxococcota bacterium]|nr:flagellar assembly protein T N-terminal domain-containing protein [Myxococcota bacterium]HRY94022.1 flagellar assembly protein T N-terminal domain-containing protein [Myxococcota bacterium]